MHKIQSYFVNEGIYGIVQRVPKIPRMTLLFRIFRSEHNECDKPYDNEPQQIVPV